MTLLEAVLKTLQALTPYLRRNPSLIMLKEEVHALDDTKIQSPAHEELAYLLAKIDVSQIRTYSSLDNTSGITVYGKNIEAHTTFIGEITAVIGKGKAVTRKKVRDAEQLYNDRDYFISQDGFIMDRHYSLEKLFLRIQLLVDAYERLVVTNDGSITSDHNKAAVTPIIDNCLRLVKSIQFKPNGTSN